MYKKYLNLQIEYFTYIPYEVVEKELDSVKRKEYVESTQQQLNLSVKGKEKTESLYIRQVYIRIP